MANPNNLPPIPQDPIGNTLQWREWFRNLGTYVQLVQTGGQPWTIAQGGTGASTAAGAVANLGLAAVAVTGNYNDLTSKPTLATVATTGQYSDLLGKPTGFTGTFLTGDLKTATVANGIITSIV